VSVRARLGTFVGPWAGTNRLWVSPGEAARESETTASVALVARDFAAIRYTWADGGRPQDGLLLVRTSSGPGALDMVWMDSWHTGGQFMVFRNEEEDEGRTSAFGTYAAPPGPDWGWRIVVAADADDEIRLLMYNVAPDGDEALAVEARYARARAAGPAEAADRPSAGR
jgi:hypothetical protein